MNNLGRREFLKAGAGGLAAMALGRTVLAADENIYAPFKMGIQSYSLRGYKTLDEALVKIKELGLQNVEFYPGHMPLTVDVKKMAEYKEKCAAAGCTAMAYGVSSFGEKPDENRKLFEFAKGMGLYCISTTFLKKGALSLDKLCEEFPDVRLGIHNHGPEDKQYKTPEDVLEAVKDRHKNIGATADLGHYLRSKQDPLECIEKLKDRLFGIHFKDFGTDGKEKIIGDAQLKVKETLALLKKLNFQGCLSLEYELNPANPMADLKEALSRVQKAVKEI